MPDMLTPKDIIEEIEFELAQGIIGKFGPGRSIGQVREFTRKTRDTILDKYKIHGNLRDIIRKQFQLTEMLLKLLEESAASFQSLQLNFEQHCRSVGLSSDDLPPSGNGIRSIPKNTDGNSLKKRYFFLSQKEILKINPAHYLKPEVPISRRRSVWLTRIVNFLKMLYHRPAYFYAGQLAKKQETVNQIFGDWLIKLNANNQNIFEKLENISGRLSRLEKEMGITPKRGFSAQPIDS